MGTDSARLFGNDASLQNKISIFSLRIFNLFNGYSNIPTTFVYEVCICRLIFQYLTVDIPVSVGWYSSICRLIFHYLSVDIPVSVGWYSSICRLIFQYLSVDIPVSVGWYSSIWRLIFQKVWCLSGFHWGLLLTRNILKQEFPVVQLSCRYHDLVNRCGISVLQITFFLVHNYFIWSMIQRGLDTSFTNLWSLLLYIQSLLHYIENAQEIKKNTIWS
jgi:hypothetical protein